MAGDASGRILYGEGFTPVPREPVLPEEHIIRNAELIDQQDKPQLPHMSETALEKLIKQAVDDTEIR